MDLSKYRQLFIDEASEHLDELSSLLVQLESDHDIRAVDELFRRVHSIKGMAAALNLEATKNLSHALEDLAGRLKDVDALPASIFDVLFRAIDILRDHVRLVSEEQEIQESPSIVESIQNALGADPSEDRGDEDPTLWCIEVEIKTGASLPAVRAFVARKTLVEHYDLEGEEPSAEMLKAGQLPGLSWKGFVLAGIDDFVIEAVRDCEGVASVRLSVVHAIPLGQAAQEKSESKELGAKAASAKVSNTIRVRTSKLDELVDGVGELFIIRDRLVAEIQRFGDAELQHLIDRLNTEIRAVHEHAMSVRMTPVRSVLDRIPRWARDLSREIGKKVEVEIRGGEIEIDRALVDALDSPLNHLVRNAVDHGLEFPHERVEQGKSEAGKFLVIAERRRDSVELILEDDGRGIDSEKIKQKALALNWLSEEEFDRMSADEINALICRPGLSTRDEVSEVSGRGVGMDVVAETIEQLGGRLEITSVSGEFTRFVISLPLSLAIASVLVVRVGVERFAIPVAKVAAVQDESTAMFHQLGRRQVLQFQHAMAPVFSLRRIFNIVESDDTDGTLVVLQEGRDFCALGVSEVLGYHEAVVKPLGHPLDGFDGYSGAAMLGDGVPMLILDLGRSLRQVWAQNI